jgi:hypothetical protein
MAAKTTIIYLTDNALDERIAETCQEFLSMAAYNAGCRIVSVSQRPIDFGDNVCVGEIGRSGLSIDKQIKAGLDATDTEFVAIAEHDCIYSAEHFAWTPPNRKLFWYNTNVWLLQYRNPEHPQYDGMFSFYDDRLVQSQLICGTDALRKAIDEKLEILLDESVTERWPVHSRLGEPGTNYMHRSRRVFKNEALLPVWHKVKDFITKYNAGRFKTRIPNIDIRHGDNFTGARRGKRRRWELAPWGSLEAIFGVVKV